ncbi:single-stranded DNA-binding protein [Megamonas hypermegale]|uniref:single-stranded DNA-binding protein n=1 Tax=Megamonas hypermegale TaxID=158847 RepID=UPI0026EADDF1|nr:single-stranded DNA-binding protein [Megamonas hypermegale]
MNKVILVGRLTKDPEVRYTQTGIAVARFNLAVNRRISKDGQQQVDFIPIVVFNKLAEICGNNLAKGRQIIMTGRIQVSSYTAQDGTKRYTTEVIMDELEFVGKKPAEAANSNNAATAEQMKFGEEVPPDEEIPF